MKEYIVDVSKFEVGYTISEILYGNGGERGYTVKVTQPYTGKNKMKVQYYTKDRKYWCIVKNSENENSFIITKEENPEYFL